MKFAVEFLRFGKYPPQIFHCCGATYRPKSRLFSTLQSTCSPLMEGENSVQINA